MALAAVVVVSLIVAANLVVADDSGARERLIEVRAGDRQIAEQALLIESDEDGLLLRLRDLTDRLPPDLPKPIPVRIDGELFLPLHEIFFEHVALDHEPGVLEFIGIAPIEDAQPELTEAPTRRSFRVGLPVSLFRPGAKDPVLAQVDEDGEEKPVGNNDAIAGYLPAVSEASPDIQPIAAAVPEGEAKETPPTIPAVPTTSRVSAPPVLVGGGRGTVRRRDPIELPLLQRDEWRESLASVILNGQNVNDGAIALQGPDDGWALRVVDLRVWRLQLDEALITTFNGEPYYRLDDLEGTSFTYDDRTLTLSLLVPARLFERTAIASARPSILPPAAGQGAFLDYDVLFLAGEGIRERLDALMEVGAFDEAGVLVSDFRLGDITDQTELVRLDTSFTRDYPSRRTSLRLGDSITVGGALGRPVRFGGIQIASNFSTDPGFVTFPLPSIGGLAEQPSVAEVFLNNTLRVTEEVPPGPFEIDNLPVVTGGGEVQLRVTDLLGREQLITQNYYVSPRLLRAGLSNYAIELGFEREGFNEKDFDYGRPLLIGSQSYGFSDAFTGEARGEVSDDRQVMGLGGAGLLGNSGLLSGGLLASHDEAAGGGYQAFADFEYRSSNINWGLRTQYADEDFRQIGLDDEPVQRVDQLSFGLGLKDYGRLGALFVNTESRRNEDQQSLIGNYSLSLGNGALLLNALQTLQPDEEFALTASYSLPLSPIRSISTTASLRDKANSARVQYRRGRGSSDLGGSYRLATEVGDQPRRIDGTFRYDAERASAQLDAVHVDGDLTTRANLSGSLAVIDAKPAASRRLGRAFGMVALPGHPDVTVYLENREVGQTDKDGYLFLPRLNPYQENRISIRPEDLPLDTEIEAEDIVAIPYERSGVKVAFAVNTKRSGLATLLDRDGEPLPAGLEMVSADGALSAQIADQGLAYIRGTAAGAVEIASVPGLPPYRCTLPPLPEEPMASLGEIRCD